MSLLLMTNMNIHHPEAKLKKALQRLKDDPRFPETNKILITKMCSRILADGHSQSRALKYVQYLKGVSKIFDKEFTKITKEDVSRFLIHINTTDTIEQWTKHDYLIITRKFYQYISKEIPIQPTEVKKAVDELCVLKIKRAKSREKLPEHLLTTEEILKLAENTTNSRDRAFILAFYESCCRIGEILPAKMKDVQFDKYGCKIFITGKTGVRPIRLIASQPAISNWLTNHPDRENPDAFLFCGIGRNNQKEMLSYASARASVADAALRAGIKKRVNLHKFRASRATELSKSLSDTVICKIGGWVPGSQELQEYLYLSGRDTDNALLEMNGLVKTEETNDGFKITICPRCNTNNSPGSKFCSGCSLGLDQKSIMDYDNLKKDNSAFVVESMQKQIDSLKTALEKILEEQPDKVYKYQRQKQVEKHPDRVHQINRRQSVTFPGKK